MSTNASTAVAATTPRPQLPLVDDPEVRAALQHLRTALERLHGEFLPLFEEAQGLPELAEAVPITTAEEYEQAQEICRDTVLAIDQKIGELLDPYCRFGDTIHKAFTGLRGLARGYTKKARKTFDDKSTAWLDEQDRIRREAERRAALERERLEHAAAVRLAIDRLLAAAAYVAEATRERDELEETAKAAADAGDTEMAEAVREEIDTGRFAPPAPPEPEMELPLVAPPAVLPEKPKAEGTSVRSNWKGRVTQGRTVLDAARFIVDHPEHAGVLMFDQATLNRAAKTYGKKLSQVLPFLEAFDDKGISRKRK